MNWRKVTVAVIRGVSHAKDVKRAGPYYWIWNKDSTKIREVDTGRPMSFITEPHVTEDLNVMG